MKILGRNLLCNHFLYSSSSDVFDEDNDALHKISILELTGPDFRRIIVGWGASQVERSRLMVQLQSYRLKNLGRTAYYGPGVTR
ncbi:unnamed protein product [Hymenolepis diminuta]|uniref:Peptidase S1 domain-containing protein n=1 Tax=Hymenolepis diminuta TaxID=6216 RepID=A0A0R3SSL2_HYMDI|nr:unnamed protein product [Hymenolepis diminuta]